MIISFAKETCIQYVSHTETLKRTKYLDFYMDLDGTGITIGTYQEIQFTKIGFHNYSTLASLSPYVGFSSIRDSIWVVENGIKLIYFNIYSLVLCRSIRRKNIT